MKIGILGSGMVGQTLAKGFKDLGHEVKIGSRDGKKVENWDGGIGKFEDVARDCDLLVLCVKGSAAEEVVSRISSHSKGKTVIDTTNPISEDPPKEGVIKFFTGPDQSLMEKLVDLSPEINFVKAFNSVGGAVMVNPDFNGVTPSMFICGNNDNSKKEVSELLKSLGWETEDMGKAIAARAIESLCMLWCIPGFLQNDWYHAFKFLKK